LAKKSLKHSTIKRKVKALRSLLKIIAVITKL